jgi:plastocyanin
MRPLLALTLIAGLASLAGTAACSDDNNGNTPTGDVSITSGASTKTTTAFSPNPFTRSLATSGQVTWVNSDGITHTVVSDLPLFDSGNVPAGDTYTFVFSAPGTYAYHCSIHPNMVGTIVIDP